MITVKKLFALLFFPLTLVLFSLVYVLYVFHRSKDKRKLHLAIWTSISLFLLFSLKPLPFFLMNRLERQYPPILSVDSSKDIKWVVVLGGGNYPDPALPLTSQISPTSLVRLMEGIRLWRQISNGRMVLSGGATRAQVSEAETMAQLGESLGISKGVLTLDIESKNTEEQSMRIKKILNEEHFYLVTSASHMPRAMLFFSKMKLNAVAAPTGFLLNSFDGPFSLYDLFPSEGWLQISETAFYEYLGLGWQFLKFARN